MPMTPSFLPARLRGAAGVLALAALYYLAARLGLLLALHASNASPVWPPSGIALAAVLLLGPRVWPGIALGAFVANLAVFSANHVGSVQALMLASAAIALGNAIEALLAAALLQRLTGTTRPFEQPQQVFRFALAILLACLGGAAIGSASLIVAGFAPPSRIITIASTWWLGDAAGMLIVGSALLAWLSPAAPRWAPRRMLEALAVAAVLLLLGALVFGGADGVDAADRRWVYVFVPCIAWVALRLDARGVTLASLLIMGMAALGTARGHGPFALGALNDALLVLQCFVGLCALTGLVLAADVAERQGLAAGAAQGRRAPGDGALHRRIALPWLVLLGALGLTVAAWQLVASDSERRARERFDFLARELRLHVEEHMQGYQQVLRGGGGLIAASPSLERAQWREYVRGLRLERAFPGIQALAVVRSMAPAEREAHVREVRDAGMPEYDIVPSGTRDEYSSIVFIEPFDARNRRAIGFDMLTEPVRRAAMLAARDSGEITLSGRLVLKQETHRDAQAGLVMYAPVYREGAPVATVAQRRAAHAGFVTGVFRMNDLMRGILGASLPEFTLRVYEGAAADASRLLYDSSGQRTGGAASAPGAALALAPAFASHKLVPLAGREWRLELASLPAFEAMIDRQKAQIVMLAGMCISLLLFLLVRSLAMTRERALRLAGEMRAAAHEAETRLRSLAESATEGIVIADAEGRVVSWNRAAQRLFGYSEGEMLGQEITLVMPERFHGGHRAAMQRLRHEGTQVTARTVELAGRARDGREFPIELSLASWEGGSGRLHSGIVRDITERRRAAQALQDSEQRIRMVTDNVPALIAYLDTERRVVVANRAYAEWHDRTPESLVGQGLAAVLGPHNLALLQPRLDRAMAGEAVSFEAELLQRGEPRTMQISYVPDRDAEGRVRGVYAMRTDVSSLRQAERQLHEVMEASPLGMFVADAQGLCLYTNQAWQRIAGLTREESLGAGWRRVLHPGDRARGFAEWNTTVREGTPLVSEYRYLRPDGRAVWVRGHVAPIRAGGGRAQWVGTVEDITEAREQSAALGSKTDALARSNAELEQFAYVASHDLQEPLRMVTSYSQLLLRRHRAHLAPEAQEFLDFVGEGGRRAQALIADLLALARVDSGAQAMGAVPLEAVLADALHELRLTVHENAAVVTHDKLPVVTGERRQLCQLFGNLLGNALKFRAGEAPRVHVQADRQAEGWRISVRDNGIGIEARHFEQVFTLFRRLHQRSHYPGTGIGLAICKKVVERHGGRIGVDSAPGQGSTFFFTLPDAPPVAA